MLVVGFVVCSARNVELLESRPDLPRQTYEHGTRVKTGWNKSASLDHCNSVPVNKNTAGSVSMRDSRPSSTSLPSANFSSLLSQTSSKNYASRSDRQSNEGQNTNSYVPSYESSLPSHGTGPQSSEVRRDLSLRNTTQSSSSYLSFAASSSNQPQPICDSQLPCLIISEFN